MALFGLTRPLTPEPLVARRRSSICVQRRRRTIRLVATAGGEPGLSRTLGADLAGRRPDPGRLPPPPAPPGRGHRARRGLCVSHLRPDFGSIARRDHARRRAARRVADRHARLLDGRGSCGQGAHDSRRRGRRRFRVHETSGCTVSKPPAFPTTLPRSRFWNAMALRARAMRAAISRSTARGATMSFSDCSRATRGARRTAS